VKVAKVRRDRRDRTTTPAASPCRLPFVQVSVNLVTATFVMLVVCAAGSPADAVRRSCQTGSG